MRCGREMLRKTGLKNTTASGILRSTQAIIMHLYPMPPSRPRQPQQNRKWRSAQIYRIIIVDEDAEYGP